jgi:hypothetical protein
MITELRKDGRVLDHAIEPTDVGHNGMQDRKESS